MNLTREQAAILRDAIGSHRAYLLRLRERMAKVGYMPADPLYQLVEKAYDAMQHLWVELHYRACDGGVGRTE